MRIAGRNSGFTLVEIIIVIIILAILAAIAIPQFTTSTRETQRTARETDLTLLRKAIQLYHAEHDQRYPTSEIATQLTEYSKPNGQHSPTKSPQYKLGPYLVKIPNNPSATGAIDPDGITVVNDTGPLTPDASPTTGWKYNSTTGEVIPNVL